VSYNELQSSNCEVA